MLWLFPFVKQTLLWLLPLSYLDASTAGIFCGHIDLEKLNKHFTPEFTTIRCSLKITGSRLPLIGTMTWSNWVSFWPQLLCNEISRVLTINQLFAFEPWTSSAAYFVNASFLQWRAPKTSIWNTCRLSSFDNLQGGLWGFQYYRPHPHKTANYRPIFIFSAVPVSPVKFFANTIETDNLENFLCTLYRDRF